MKSLFTAACLAPIDQPPIRDGALLIESGRILAVGPAAILSPANPDAARIDLGNSTILPGLVNAHTHLELSDACSGPAPSGGFSDWLLQIVQRRPIDPEKLSHQVTTAIATGVDKCLRFGVTTIGDISRHPHLTRPLLRNTPLRIVSYGEVQALGQRRILLDQRLSLALDRTHATDRLRIGLSPHAPYTVEIDAYRRCVEIARAHSLPLATHLAESPDESIFLSDLQGGFRSLWDTLGAFDDLIPRFAGGPIRMARAAGLLDYPTLLAHVNYCDDDELDLLAAGRAAVVYNPRTHRYFSHPPHRWREMLARGINVAVGTDSCASSPDLNLVEELRLLHHLAPDIPAATLWGLATVRAARALAWDNDLGSLTPGKHADFIAFPTSAPDPLDEILRTDILPTSVWIAAQQVQ